MRNRRIGCMLIASMLMLLTVSNIRVQASTGRQAIADAAEFYFNTTWRPTQEVHGWYDDNGKKDSEYISAYIKDHPNVHFEYDSEHNMRIDHYYLPTQAYHIPYGQAESSQIVGKYGRYIDGNDDEYGISLDKFAVSVIEQPKPIGESFEIGDFYKYMSDLGVYRLTMFMDCSSFVTTCWGVKRQVCSILKEKRAYYGKLRDSGVGLIEQGDALVYYSKDHGGHVVIISDFITYDNINHVEVPGYDEIPDTITSYIVIEANGEAGTLKKSRLYTPQLLDKYGGYSVIKPTEAEIGNRVWTKGRNGYQLGSPQNRDGNVGKMHGE